MRKQETIFDFLGHVFLLFGITVALLLVISQVLGNEAKEYSVMFSLGSDGLATATLIQFLSISFIITGLNVIFASDKLMKTGSTALRMVGLLASVIIVMSLFIYLFKWFPMNSLTPWILFFVLFFVSFAISVVVVFWKEKLENKKMEEGLKRVKAQLEEDSNA